MKYICKERTCNYEGAGVYTIILKGELSVDIHNIASMFCPYCQNIMMPVEAALDEEDESMEVPV